MVFDRSNDYQSPLAHALLANLPMVEEVTIGPTFVTVKRVEDEDTEAAARYFALQFHGVQSFEGVYEEATTAARSQALQHRVTEAMCEEESAIEDNSSTTSSAGTQEAPTISSPSPSHTEATKTSVDPFDVGGFTVTPSTQDEQIDEAALQSLIAATDWSELKFHVSALLTDHLSSGEPHISRDAPHPHADTLPVEGDSDIVLMIKELISTTIRPQLQHDGGDIRLVRFVVEEGCMEVEMLGACRTCKSSKTTLVDVIERTTRHWIPEVMTVKDVTKSTSTFEKFIAEQYNRERQTPSPTVATSNGAAHTASENEAVKTPASPVCTVTMSLHQNAPGSFKVVREVKPRTAL